MGNRFASGKNAIAECDRCDFRYPLKVLRREVIKGKNYELLVCPTCWDPDQPQLQLGMYPVSDPQAIREPRPDTTYYSSGLTGLQTKVGSSTALDESGYPADGSRQIQWGFNPVGMKYDFNETPNALQSKGVTNSVTIS